MAKWGEGDPRWICEERPDAKNVNNWHWSDKNATPWSKTKFKELLVGLKIENDKFSVKIKELSKTSGEATVNNRKSKLIFFYDWVIHGDWEGVVIENKKKFKGTFEIINLSEEHDPQDIDINVGLKEEDKNKNDELKEFMRKDCVNKIKEQLATYIRLLKEEFSQGLILPLKNGHDNQADRVITSN